MAINKNFVIKNGVQVATDLIVGDSDTKKVGIGTTIAGYTLHVGATNVGGRGGIGATDAVITGVGTIKDLLVSGASGFSSDVSVSGIVSAQSFGIGTTEIIDRGMRLSGIASLDAITIATIEEAIRVGPNSFSDLKVTGLSTFVGIATFLGGIDVDVQSGVSTFSAPVQFGLGPSAASAVNNFVATAATVGFGTSAFFRDNAAIFMGDDSDLKIYHDSSNSYIDDQGTGDLIIRGSADIKLQSSSGENYIIANDTGSVEQYFDDSKKTETTSGGFKVTGITTLTNRLHVQAGVSTFDADVRFGIGATVGFGTSAFFKDEASIFMGDADDFELFHDGSDSIIRNRTGDLKLLINDTENGIIIKDNEGVEAYFDDSKKVETTSGGLKVTGITTLTNRLHVQAGVSTFDADVRFGIGATVGFGTSAFFKDDAAIYIGDDSDLRIYSDGSTSFLKANDLRLQSLTGESYITNTANGAVVLFYDDGSVLQTTPQGINISGVTTSNRLNISGVSTFNGLVDINAGGQANTFKVEDLTDNRVVIVGSGGELEDSGNLTFDGTTLAVTGKETVSVDITVGSGVTIQNHGGVSIAGITTVGGNLLAGGDILPDNDGERDLGSSSKEFQDLFIDGTANIDSLAADTAAIGDLTNDRVVIVGTSGELEDSGNLTFNGSHLAVTGDGSVSGTFSVGTGASVHATTGNAAFAGIVTTGGALIVGGGATITGNILPAADDSVDLGASGLEFKDLFIDGTARIDALEADTAKITDLGENQVVFSTSSAGELNSTSNLTFDDATLGLTGDQTVSGKITVGSGASIHASTGNAAFAGIVTANGGIRVGTAITIHPHGGVSIAGIVTIGSDLNVQGDIVYDEITGRNLNITGISTQAGQVNFGTSGVGATISVNGNATFAGIVTAAQFQGGGVGVGIGSTTDNPFSGEKVGYGFTFIKFAGPGVSTVYADTRAGYTGFATVFIEGGGSSVGAAGTWQNDQVGISTAKSVGVNTSTINDADLQGRPHVGAAGSFKGLYIGNGMIVNDNALNGDHYIGTAFGGMMAGPVTINGVLTVDGSYVVV